MFLSVALLLIVQPTSCSAHRKRQAQTPPFLPCPLLPRPEDKKLPDTDHLDLQWSTSPATASATCAVSQVLTTPHYVIGPQLSSLNPACPLPHPTLFLTLQPPQTSVDVCIKLGRYSRNCDQLTDDIINFLCSSSSRVSSSGHAPYCTLGRLSLGTASNAPTRHAGQLAPKQNSRTMHVRGI